MINGHINSEDDLRKLCRESEVVFHLAACISIRKNDQNCITTNTESCKVLLNAARSEGVRRIIHFSSIHAFNHEPLDSVLDETREVFVNSKVSYDRSKALGHKLMLEASSSELQVVVLNPTAIIGPNDFKPSLLGNAIIRFYKGKNPSLIPSGYDWVDVRDVCDAAINAIDMGVPGECYLIGGSWQSLRVMADTVAKLGGHKAPALYLPMWLAWIGAGFLNLHARITKSTPLYTSMSLKTLEHSHRNISHQKAAAVLKYNPRPFEVTMADTIEWFKENNYI
jgi:dihydroflavonol-4-reductase